ncbi:hypothetical protein HD841_002532 [Sphingomonas melonis]|uniref:Uncharacterized protein n=1 Tax=Sphingomonas melonis TaxID=152682 RepID=A0A7Y9FNW7_9SPHN|nr:hypothetical protein [Sphingomonas melonis]
MGRLSAAGRPSTPAAPGRGRGREMKQGVTGKREAGRPGRDRHSSFARAAFPAGRSIA